MRFTITILSTPGHDILDLRATVEAKDWNAAATAGEKLVAQIGLPRKDVQITVLAASTVKRDEDGNRIEEKPIRIKAVDSLGNVAYLHQTKNGGWACNLANGICASFSYAGIREGRETECKFALLDAKSAAAALAAVKRLGTSTYSLV